MYMLKRTSDDLIMSPLDIVYRNSPSLLQPLGMTFLLPTVLDVDSNVGLDFPKHLNVVFRAHEFSGKISISLGYNVALVLVDGSVLSSSYLFSSSRTKLICKSILNRNFQSRIPHPAIAQILSIRDL